MTNQELFAPKRPFVVWIVFFACLMLSLAAFVTASLVQRDFGKVDVSNVTYPNANGIPIRAKLFVPNSVSAAHPAPGVVYIHGYQNNRETSDAYCIEMARRGFVVLEIDAIGRGNSGNPGDVHDPAFDPTYGGRTSLQYLKSLPSVDPARVGLMGHSLGAEMAYTIALSDPNVQALAFSGFAYTTAATREMPRNMLMIYGQYDEYRKRMTGTRDVAAEWMKSPQTQAAFPVPDPSFGVVYGDFDLGTARQVVLLPTIHLFESHSREGIAAAVNWMRRALHPADASWIDPGRQIWEIKEWATLVAMLAGLAALMPLGLILLRTRFFSSLQGQVSTVYACTGREYLRHAGINGLLMWLYLPLIFMLFGLHVYVVHIDKVFPMMMVNGTVWWFVWMNIIGFFILRRWRKRRAGKDGLTWADLGISFDRARFVLDGKAIGKTALLAAILFAICLSVRACAGTGLHRRLPLPLPLRQRLDLLPGRDVAALLPLSAARLSADGLLPARPAAAASQEDLATDPVRLVCCQHAGPGRAADSVPPDPVCAAIDPRRDPLRRTGRGAGQFHHESVPHHRGSDHGHPSFHLVLPAHRAPLPGRIRQRSPRDLDVRLFAGDRPYPRIKVL